MANQPINIHPDIKDIIAGDELARYLSIALKDIFSVTSYKKTMFAKTVYRSLFCKPTKTIANALLIDREVVALLTNYTSVQARSINILIKMIEENKPRLQPNVAIILHSDKSGDDKLRVWGREQGITIIPIHRPRGSALPSSSVMRQKLARELFSSDPFQVTGPVFDDIDFFGRKNESLELLRQLNIGRIRSLFGIRKIGKTSLLNRVIALSREASSPRVAVIDCSLTDFNKLNSQSALKALAKACKMAMTRGYCHISDALKTKDEELVPVFDDLWKKGAKYPLSII